MTINKNLDKEVNAFKAKFNGTERLYHFTSFSTGMRILAGEKLKFSKLSGMNDINESYRPVFSNSDIYKIEAHIKKYRQISLSRDIKDKMV